MVNDGDNNPKNEIPSSGKPSTMEQIRPYLDMLSKIAKQCVDMAVVAWKAAKPLIIEILSLLKEGMLKIWALGKAQYHKYVDKKPQQP